MDHTFDMQAKQVLDYIGGCENVQEVTHCATRLRFRLKDESLADETSLKSVEGVLMLRRSLGELQIVIGMKVPYWYRAVVHIMEQSTK